MGGLRLGQRKDPVDDRFDASGPNLRPDLSGQRVPDRGLFGNRSIETFVVAYSPLCIGGLNRSK